MGPEKAQSKEGFTSHKMVRFPNVQKKFRKKFDGLNAIRNLAGTSADASRTRR
jgi:hypothetical protein